MGSKRPPDRSVQEGEREGWLKSLGRNPKSLTEECQVRKEITWPPNRGVT